MANKGYIAAVLCEKRNEPESFCEGKCYLKKQLKEAGEKEQKKHAPVKEVEPLIYLVTIPFSVPDPLIALVKHSQPPQKADNYSFYFLSKSLRPPDAEADIML